MKNNLADIHPGARRALPKSGDAYKIVRLKEEHIDDIDALYRTVFNDLARHERDFVSHKNREDFAQHFAAGHAMVGVLHGERLAAQSLIITPTAAHPATGVYGMDFDAPLADIAVLGSSIVHPEYRGNGLQGEMVDACIRLAHDTGRKHMISDVCTDNHASWKTFMNKGLSIQGIGADPAISPMSVYFLHAELKPLVNGDLRAAFNRASAVSVPMPDFSRQKELLAQGYRGVSYDSVDNLIAFKKIP